MWADLHHLFGGELYRPELVAHSARLLVPRSDWLAPVLQALGLGHVAPIYLVFGGYIVALTCLLLGFLSRPAAWAALLFHVMWTASGPESNYGVDTFARIALFICAIAPTGAVFSLDARRAPMWTSERAARRGLFLLQCLLAIAYGFSGYEKALGPDWWNGESIYRAMYLDSPHMAEFLTSVPFVAVFAGWGTLALEMGWPLLVWMRPTRRPLLVATMLMHLGILLTIHLVSFCAVMILLNLTLYLYDPHGHHQQARPEHPHIDRFSEPSHCTLHNAAR